MRLLRCVQNQKKPKQQDSLPVEQEQGGRFENKNALFGLHSVTHLDVLKKVPGMHSFNIVFSLFPA